MNPFTALFRTAARGQAGRVRLALERHEGRNVPSGVTLVPSAGSNPIPQTVRFYEYDSTHRTITPDHVRVNNDLPVNLKG
jgi:hypothetical protein